MQHSVFGKRLFLKSGLAIGLSCSLTHANAEDEWGKDQDYPIGWGPQGLPQRWEAYPAYRVGNYSGGFERMFLHNRIQPPKEPSPLTVKPVEIKYGPFGSKTPNDYMNSWPITSLLIARDGKILFESYRMDRTPSMRMTKIGRAHV